MSGRKRVLAILLALLVIAGAVWGVSLIRCEVLTHKYFYDFERAYTQNTMLGDMAYFKVLHCDGNTAQVYYVSKGMTDANVLTFVRQGGAWTETAWRAVWSDTGSASGVIYPYWWHFIYGGL